MIDIPYYPESITLHLELRPFLHDRLRVLTEGISEFTFANLFLFREKHQYRLALLEGDLPVILGRDAETPFFMLPFGIPDAERLQLLFSHHTFMKCVSSSQKNLLERAGYRTIEDRDNFDYLYLRDDLANLKGRKFHKKRNLIKAFVNNHEYTAQPLLDSHLPDARAVLEGWHKDHGDHGDYGPALEALDLSWELQLCGGIYFVGQTPVAYSLGEELAAGKSFVIHFEKALSGYKGLYQFINQTFASILPDSYETINREQDLGDTGLRQAKHSYKPLRYVTKYLAFV